MSYEDVSSNPRTAAQRVKQLEKEAAELHLRAQELNKLGKYADAKALYSTMHQMEDEASRLAKELGCLECALGAPEGSSCATPQPSDLPLYTTLHAASKWPTTQSQTSGLTVRQRAFGAMLGAAVADAAAMGVQWVYDLQLLQRLLEERQLEHGQDAGLEFYDPPQSPYFSYASGRSSPYGEQAAVLLGSLAREGGLHCLHYAQSFAERFGEGFDGYRDVSMKGFLRNFEQGLMPPLSGANDAQANCITRAAPVVAAYCGDPRLIDMVEAAARVTQNTDAACAWGAAGASVLEGIMLGATCREAVEATIEQLTAQTGRLAGAWGLSNEVAAKLEAALGLASVPPKEAVAQLGRNCHMPNALQTPLQAVLYVEQEAGGHLQAGDREAYVRAVRYAIHEGGCCSSRATFTGACMGALLGEDAVPEEWRRKFSGYAATLADARAVCSTRDS